MTRIARLLTILVTALAVPLQGAAAVSAAQCVVLGHQGMADGQLLDHSGGGHESALHGHSSGHSHPGDGTKRGGQHRGPCVGCCASVSIAASIAVVPLLVPAVAVAEISYRSYLSAPPDQLDRPPSAL